MPVKSSATQDSLVVAVGLTLAGVGIAAFYLTNDERTKSRWQRDTNSRLNPRSSSSNRGGDASRYPYVARDRNRLRSSSSVRYGKDGRRTLLRTSSTTSGLNVASEEAKEGVFFDPRQQALSSGDILLHVLHFLERRDVLSCGIVSTLFRQTATDDTIWIHHAKEFASRNIDSVHAGPSLLRNAGLDSVMDMLYARLPKDYLEICRHWTPSRERAASGIARKSWHRWLLTMTWLRRARQQEAEKGAPILDSGFVKAMDKYGTMFYFPEQIISFVSSLYRACCEDYWGELIPIISSEQQQQDVKEQQCPELMRIVRARAPLWGDMLAVLNGYIRLYRGRNFIDWKGNMGFLLQDPANTIVTSNPDGGIRQEGDPEVYPASPASPPMRQLQIPCTHGLFMQALASTEERFQGWPYQKQITLDGLLAYLKA